MQPAKKPYFRIKARLVILVACVLCVWAVQELPAWADAYSQTLYPHIARILSGFSNLFPFAVGDVFIGGSIAGLIAYPFYARLRSRKPWRHILLREGEYLAWIYVWFYLAWGLNYSQKGFYERTRVPYAAYNAEKFELFLNDYIARLNTSYTAVPADKAQLAQEAFEAYNRLSEYPGGVHRPARQRLRAKTMLWTPLMSKVGVTGSMGPFFCEFTINGDELPYDYPATYMHELAHSLGITSEAEASFYAYQACAMSNVAGIRFSGYFSVLGYVLGNARSLLDEEKYKEAVQRIRPEIIRLAQEDQAYWSEKYSPFIGHIQNWIYDLYLRGNRISSGRKNYSEVVGLLVSYHEHTRAKQ